jgi:paraquat-inducible protein A
MSTASRTAWFRVPVQTIRQRMRTLVRPECILAGIATLTFPLAVLLPFFTFSPSFGDVLLDAGYDYVNPGALDPATYSVLGGIARLFTDGDYVVAVVLLLFSVLFPAVKLALLWGVLIRPYHARLSLVRGLETLGPWSMADVFVVSVLLLAFKSFPGGTTFAIQAGYYIFLVSVITSLVATWVAKHRLERTLPRTSNGAVATQARPADQTQLPTVPAPTNGAPASADRAVPQT